MFQHETQYLLEKPFGEKSIREFVFNFTMNLIPRDLRSTVGSSKHTHYFGSDKVETPFNDVTESVDKSCQKKSVSIEELNTLSFREFISQKNKVRVHINVLSLLDYVIEIVDWFRFMFFSGVAGDPLWRRFRFLWRSVVVNAFERCTLFSRIAGAHSGRSTWCVCEWFTMGIYCFKVSNLDVFPGRKVSIQIMWWLYSANVRICLNKLHF